jgi:putative transposase
LDEVQLKIKGKRHWLWRAVDKHGVVLDILVQQRRDQVAAETFLRRVLAAASAEPRVVITDKLASYPPALRGVLPNTEHRRHKGLTTGQRTRTSQRVSVSVLCGGSSQPSMHRVSWVRLARSAITSARAATAIPRRLGARC